MVGLLLEDKHIKIRKDLTKMIVVPFIISIIFFVFWMYACNTANIGEEENVKFETSVKHLFEAKNTVDYYNVDDYINKTLLPNYRHYQLYYKISKYQNSENNCVPAFIIFLFLSIIASSPIINIGFEPLVAIILSLLINATLYIVIALLFSHTPVFKKLKLKNYSDVCNEYISEYHYEYLTEIEEAVMFRYFLRKIISGIAMILFLLNIWSSDTY